MLPDFEIKNKGNYAKNLNANNISRFYQLVLFLNKLDFGDISKENDLNLIFQELKTNDTSTHTLLVDIALINNKQDLELTVGICIFPIELHPKITDILIEKRLNNIPYIYTYIKFKSERFDFTNKNNFEFKFSSLIVREQRCDTHQIFDWKPMILKNYLNSWINRNQIPFSLDEILKICTETPSLLNEFTPLNKNH